MTETASAIATFNFAEVKRKASELRTNASNSSPQQAKELKRKANIMCREFCESFIHSNSIDFNDYDKLENMPIHDLVFLYIYLKYSDIENIKEIRENIDCHLYGRINDSIKTSDITEIRHIKKFVRYRLDELQKEKNNNEYIHDLRQQYSQYLQQIKELSSALQVTVSQDSKEFRAPNLKEISDLGSEYFTLAQNEANGSIEKKSLRRQGNQAVTNGCFEYLQSINQQDWEKLSTKDLIFLHKNTRFDRKNKTISDKILTLIQLRLKNAINQIDNGNLPNEQELISLMFFCKYRAKDIEKSPNKDDLFEANEINLNLPKLVKARTLINKEINSEGKKQLSENKPEKTQFNSITSAFEQVCDEKNIHYTKADNKENGRKEYELYSQNTSEPEKPNGKLSVRSETSVDLQSEDQTHFIALVQAVKNTGAQSITIGELNPNKEKALKFVAQLSLAGAQVGIKVSCSEKFSNEELIAAYPDYAKAADIVRQRIERNKKRYYHNRTHKPQRRNSPEAFYHTGPISSDRGSR